MSRVAVLDCGTNSARLLVADVSDGRLTDVTRRLEINRLGEGVDRTGRLSQAALQRTRRVLTEYASAVDSLDVTDLRVVATSATRDAVNRTEFVDLVKGLFGVAPEVISGAEEAALSFRGAVRSLDVLGEGPVLVCDIGGGSTELVRGQTPARGGELVVTEAYSMDIGCVRLTERLLRSDPPTTDEVDAAVSDIAAALGEAAERVPLTDHRTFVGLAGTVTTMAALVLGLPSYEELETHGAVMTRSQVEATSSRLLSMTHDQRAAEPVIHQGRVDVIGAGALILREVLRRTGSASVLVSEHDILDGIAWSVADRMTP